MMNSKELVLKIIKDKVDELNIKDVEIKSDKDDTIVITINNIKLGEGDLYITVEKANNNYLLISMNYKDDNNTYKEKIKTNNPDELFNIICSILNNRNYNGAHIHNDNLLKEFLGEELFYSIFKKGDIIGYPAHYKYLKDTQSRLNEFEKTIEELMTKYNLVQHIFHKTYIDNTKQRYWINIA